MFNFLLGLVLILIACRCALIARKRSRPLRKGNSTCSIAIFLGSGGHTSEALALVSSLNFSRYTPRTYIISQGDRLSAQKAKSLELSRHAFSDKYTILTVPRARHVHQSLLTTVFTAGWSLLLCVYYMTIAPLTSSPGAISADVLFLNGPGTCFTLCMGVYINRFLGLQAPRMIYVESFARVRSYSFSGKLLYPLVDRFVVQWPQLMNRPGAEYRGWLV